MAVANEVSKASLVVPKQRERSPLGDALKQLLKNKVAVGSALFIILLILASIFADFLNAYVLQGYQDALGPNQPSYAKQALQDNNAQIGQLSKAPSLEGFVYWFSLFTVHQRFL